MEESLIMKATGIVRRIDDAGIMKTKQGNIIKSRVSLVLSYYSSIEIPMLSD